MQNYTPPHNSDEIKPPSGKTKSTKKYHTHKAPMIRINISIQQGLLDKIDEVARQDYTTRSDIIRMALLWYTRPQGRELKEVDQDEILKTLQRRKQMRQSRKVRLDGFFDDLDVYDG